MTTVLMELRNRSALDVLLDSLRLPNIPVHPDDIADRLGIGVEIGQTSATHEGELSRVGQRYVIRVAPAAGAVWPDGFSSRQRFSIAHELAHYFQLTRQHVMPTDAPSIERKCDVVASQILLPHAAVSSQIRLVPSDRLASAIAFVADEAWVSDEVSARRWIAGRDCGVWKYSSLGSVPGVRLGWHVGKPGRGVDQAHLDAAVMSSDPFAHLNGLTGSGVAWSVTARPSGFLVTAEDREASEQFVSESSSGVKG